MSNCPYCGAQIGRLRRVLMPRHISCPACAGLCRVQTPIKVRVWVGLSFLVLFSLLLWAERSDHAILSSLLVAVMLIIGMVTESIGPLAPRSRSVASFVVVGEELRSYKWSWSFLAFLVVAVVVVVGALIIYSNW